MRLGKDYTAWPDQMGRWIGLWRLRGLHRSLETQASRMTFLSVTAAVLILAVAKCWRDDRAYKRWIAEHRAAHEAEMAFYAKREQR